MRVFGVLGLVLAVLIVGLLARNQLKSLQAPIPALATPEGSAAPAAAPTGNVRQQSQQLQQQYKQALEQAVQQPRPMPDDIR